LDCASPLVFGQTFWLNKRCGVSTMWASDLVASPLHLSSSPEDRLKQYSDDVTTFCEELQAKEKETGLRACVVDPLVPWDATALPTMQQLQTTKVAWLSEECLSETQNLKKKLERESGPKGSVDKQYKALAAELRRGGVCKFKTLLAVTFAVKERSEALLEMEDVPAAVQQLLTQAAAQWQKVIIAGLPVDSETESVLLSMLKKMEDDMGNLPEPMSFGFAPPASATPIKRRRPLESVDGTPDCESNPAKRPVPNATAAASSLQTPTK